MSNSGLDLPVRHNYTRESGLLRTDLEYIKNHEARTRREILSRLERIENNLLEIFVERVSEQENAFQAVVFRDGDIDRALFQIEPSFYCLWVGENAEHGPKALFYATKPSFHEDFYQFSNLIPFHEVPEVREAKLRDPNFGLVVMGITPAS